MASNLGGAKSIAPCEATETVHPEGVSVTGLGQRVKEFIEVEVTCDVSRVKPAADIYWRKGPDGPLQTGTTSDGTNSDGKTCHLQSTYKVSFNRSEHNTKLYCLVTRPGDRTDVWAAKGSDSVLGQP
ncbi:hypothetical protein NP493_561g01043 [Ridgeia piscesae]|uniref:CD80-like immunoglobulin C2-set domain-containing protein n=1 Tax=Ridgeia piscesae TaxID=27915 RepID=A0AAD9KVL0_RIDPI|nr:hypothetical protein NP493_561g01043 [Ridgeia piscesae]